jgi:hypothetical protein
MAKSYNTLPSKSSGDTISVANWTNLKENHDNCIVRPAAVVRRAAGQSIANLTFDWIEFDTEEVDTDSMVDLGSDDEIITINTAGLYICTARVDWNTGSSDTHREATIIDGSNSVIAEDTSQRPILGDKTHSISALWNFSASDTVKLRVYHGSGSALDVDEATLAVCFLSLTSAP